MRKTSRWPILVIVGCTRYIEKKRFRGYVIISILLLAWGWKNLPKLRENFCQVKCRQDIENQCRKGDACIGNNSPAETGRVLMHKARDTNELERLFYYMIQAQCSLWKRKKWFSYSTHWNEPMVWTIWPFQICHCQNFCIPAIVIALIFRVLLIPSICHLAPLFLISSTFNYVMWKSTCNSKAERS